MNITTKRLHIVDSTPGEIGLGIYFVEKEKLIIPGSARPLLTLTLKDADGPAGLIQFYEGHAPPGVVGFSSIVFDPGKRNLGYMCEALDALLKESKFVRIEASPAADNTSACKGLEKLGFKLEGILKSWYPRDGKYVDAAMYAKVGD